MKDGFAQLIQGKWNQIKGQLQQEYAQLTEDDLAYQEGKEDELIGRLQEKLGKTREDIRAQISEISKKI